MLHASSGRRPSLLGRAFLQALVFGVVPLGTAMAQTAVTPPALYVRVTRDEVDISSLRGKAEVRMHAPKGTVLEVFHIDGDRYKHLDSNWYWVLLPEDKLGTRPVGWVRGDDVEFVPAPKSAETASLGAAPVVDRSARGSSAVIALERPPVERAPVEDAPPAAAVRSVRIPDVVLNFQFGRSDLTEESKGRLATAIAVPKTAVQALSVALEGYADWVGTEPYNERLGLARAETVRRYLAEHLQIPAERISVVSYGESSPVAPNTTREGRAQNRRVVIKVAG
jgi:outer membrane protein OmpA-like peptidoglycan-associated protein